MAFREYGNYDGIGLADLVRKKQVSAAELLDEAIARTAKVDPEINAVVVKHYDYARRQIDRGLPDGPFTGVPFLLKDLDLLETTRTTFGASVFKENVAMRFMGPKCRAPMSHRRRRGLFRRRSDAIRGAEPPLRKTSDGRAATTTWPSSGPMLRPSSRSGSSPRGSRNGMSGWTS